MKHAISAGLVVSVLFLLGCQDRGAFTHTVHSTYDMNTTIKRFKQAMTKRHMTLFTIIDHQANAQKAHLAIRPTRVALFGQAKVGTALMLCKPEVGVDLPMRMLFWQDYEGIVKITYTNPEYLSLKYNIKDKTCLALLRNMRETLHDIATEAGGRPQ